MKKRINIYELIIFVFGFILYANTLGNSYALDDKAVIWSNKFTQKGVAGMPEILKYDSMAGLFGTDTNLEGGRYRPLSLLTFAIEIEIFGHEIPDDYQTKDTYIGCPFVQHLVNVLLYCCTLLLLFKVLKKLFRNYETKYEFLSIPFIATLLFAAHPLHTEIVANIKGRDEILAFLFSFAALDFALKFIDLKTESGSKRQEIRSKAKGKSQNNSSLFSNNSSLIYILMVFVCMFLGAMAKETTVTFLAIIPLCIYFFREDVKLIKYTYILVPAILGVGLYFLCRYAAIGNSMGLEVTNLMNNPFFGMTTAQRYATIIFTLLLYLKLLVFPHPLTWDYYPYHIETYEFSNIWVIISILIHLTLAVIAILGLKKKSVFSFAILFYVITLSITSNLVFNIGAFMNERFIYFSLLGFCIIIAYFFSLIIPKIIKNVKIYKSSSIAIISIVLLLFSVKVISRNKDWYNSFSLFEHDVKISSESAKGNSSWASALYTKSEMAEAQQDTVLRNKYLLESIPFLEKSIEIYPKYEEPLIYLGNCYYRLYNDHKTMFEYYIKALEVNEYSKDVWNNSIGVLTINLDDPPYEKYIWKKYTELSDYHESFYQLGMIYKAEQNNDSALYYFEKAYDKNKTNYDILYNLADCYGLKSNFNKAREILFECLKIKQDANVYRMLGLTYGIQNDNKNALIYFDKALQLDPKNQELQNLVMRAKSMLKN